MMSFPAFFLGFQQSPSYTPETGAHLEGQGDRAIKLIMRVLVVIYYMAVRNC